MERRFLDACALLGALAVSGCDDPLRSAPPRLALTGATVIDGTGSPEKRGHTILIENGRIAAVEPDGTVQIPDNTETLDLTGSWIVPGLVDTHVHMPARAQQDRFLRTFLAFGVTTVRTTAVAPEGGVDLRERIRSGEQIGPRLVTSGRLIDGPGTVWPDFGSVVSTEGEMRAEIDRQAAQGVDLVKLYALVPPDLVRAAAEQAHAHGLPVLGHLGRTTWTEALAAGVDEFTHSCIWGAAHSLVPVPDSARFADFFTPNSGFDAAQFAEWNATIDPAGERVRAFMDGLAARDASWSPNLVLCEAVFWGDDPRTLARLRPEFDISPQQFPHPFFADWTEAERAAAQVAFSTFLDLVALAHDAGARITTGSDALNPWMTPGPSLHREMELLVRAGIPPVEVIRIATANGAVSLGLAGETGTIQAGRWADLVVLGSDPLADIGNARDVDMVLLGGVILQPERLLGAP